MIWDLGLNSNTSWRCHGHIVKPHLRKANDRISTKLTSIWEYIWPLSLLFTKTSYTTLYPRFCVSNQIRNHQKISNMSECWFNIYYIKILIGLFKIFQNIVIRHTGCSVMMMMMRWHFDNTYLNQNKKAGNENSINMAKPLFVIICIFPLKILIKIKN